MRAVLLALVLAGCASVGQSRPEGVPPPPTLVEVPPPETVPASWTSDFQRYAWQRYQVVGDHKQPEDHYVADDAWTYMCVLDIAQTKYPQPTDFVNMTHAEFRELWEFTGTWCF